jgi:hypothetical protein
MEKEWEFTSYLSDSEYDNLSTPERIAYNEAEDDHDFERGWEMARAEIKYAEEAANSKIE